MKKIILSVILIFLVLFAGTSVLAKNYMFESFIDESNNELTVILSISESVNNNYFVINAYKDSRVVANKLIKADNLFQRISINCSAKPDEVKVTIWNSLSDIQPIIDPVKYVATTSGNKQTFEPIDGYPEDFSTITGCVISNDKTSVTSTIQMERDYIKIQTSDNQYNIYAPDIDYDYYLGRNVTVSYTINSEDIAVLKSINEAKTNKTAVIDNPQNIVLDGYSYASDLLIENGTIHGIISVYDVDVDITNTEYILDNANVIYNGEWISPQISDIKPDSGKVKLLDNDGDNQYDFIFITSYETKVVDCVFEQNTKIAMKSGPSMDLKNHIIDKEGYSYSIKLDGKEIDISELMEYDVLTITSSKTERNIEILVSRNIVKGAVEGVYIYYPNALKYEYIIGGKTYTLATAELATYVKASTKGFFFLDVFDRIAYVEEDKSFTDNVAFIMSTGNCKVSDETIYDIEVLNKDGSIVFYNLADSISVKNNNTFVGNMNNREVAEMIDLLMEKGNSTANYANRIISYLTNAKDEIISITFPDSNGGEGLSIAEGSECDEYDSSTSSLKYGVTDKTIIFYLPFNELEGSMRDEFRILNISHLQNGSEYTTAYLDIDKDGNAGIMIITDYLTLGETDALAIVTGKYVTTNAKGEKVLAVKFLKNGLADEKLITADSALNAIDGTDVFARGSIFEYTLNFDGEIEDAKFCGLSQTDTLTWQEVKSLVQSIPTNRTGNMNFEYIGGYVVGKSGSTLALSTDFTASTGDLVAIPENANIYTMDVSRSKVTPHISAIGDIVKCQYYEYNGYFYAEEGADTYVLIKYIDNKIVDVIAYYGFEPSTQIW